MDNYVIIAALISSTITLIGIISSAICFTLNPHIQNRSNQKHLELQAMDDSCKKLLSFLKGKSNIKEGMKLLNSIRDNICIYGTKDEIKLLRLAREQIYNADNIYIVVVFVLLFAVIKRDTYNQFFDPRDFYEIYITDYENSKDRIVKANNFVVRKGKFGNKYYIK